MSESATTHAIDAGHFRSVLGQYPTGVCVVTSVGRNGEPVGMTVGTFTSVSLDPPLVAFLPTRGSRVLETIQDVGRFAVNFLAGDQIDLCRRFAASAPDKFRSVPWHPSPLGSPLIVDAPAWIDCQVDSVLELGDHALVVGAVDSLDIERTTAPLMFFQGGFGKFSALSMVADTEDHLGAHLRLADLARPMLEEIANSFGVHVAASALVGQQVIQLAWIGTESPDLATYLVGLRLPFVAPFGLLFAAWESDEARRAWLRDADDQLRSTVLDNLARARRQGWAVIPDHPTLREIETSIARIAADGRLPAAVRELEAQIAEFAHQYIALSAGRPRGVSVPVFDHVGRVVLTLTAQRLPEMDSERLDRCRSALVAAGEELTNAINGVPAGNRG
jgi:flavin reductase (DIM6/NTAB) family NADH-FMN oxidoreductase RutF